MKTVFEFSSGGIIFRQRRRVTQVCLIATHEGKIWQLPKGTIEKGETIQEAALREVKEETGLEGIPLKKIGKIEYWYVTKDTPKRPIKHHKVVHFFLMKYTQGTPTHQAEEVDAAAWYPLEKALDILGFPNEQKILRKAKNMIARLEG